MSSNSVDQFCCSHFGLLVLVFMEIFASIHFSCTAELHSTRSLMHSLYRNFHGDLFSQIPLFWEKNCEEKLLAKMNWFITVHSCTESNILSSFYSYCLSACFNCL